MRLAFRRWRPGKLLDVLQCIGQPPAPRGVIWPQVAVAGPACVWLRQEHVAQSCAVSAGGGAGQPELRTRLLIPAGPAWKRLLLLLIDDPVSTYIRSWVVTSLPQKPGGSWPRSPGWQREKAAPLVRWMVAD